MKKSDLINSVCKATGLSKAQARRVVNIVISALPSRKAAVFKTTRIARTGVTPRPHFKNLPKKKTAHKQKKRPGEGTDDPGPSVKGRLD